MPRLVFLLALLLASADLAAADLEIMPWNWPPSGGSHGGNGFVRGELRVVNNGPEPVDDAVVTIAADPPATKMNISIFGGRCTNGECRLDAMAAGDDARVVLYINAPFPSGRVTITATVTSSAADPAPRNNVARPTVQFVDKGPDLDLGLSVSSPSVLRRSYSPLQSIPPEEIAFLDVTVSNGGDLTATDVVVKVEFPDGAKVISSESAKFECDLATARATCRTEVLRTRNSGEPPHKIRFGFLAPPLYQGGRLRFSATITANEFDRYPVNNEASTEVAINRFFVVSTTADSGPGSLRQAILDANAQCTELFPRIPGGPTHAQLCTIGFRIPGPLPDSGFFTIQPLSPLPVVNFLGTIHGVTQAGWLGVDAGKPLLMLDGSRLSGATDDGLVIITSTDVSELAIGNFPRNGVSVETRPESRNTYKSVYLERVYIGVDPSGRTAAPNERGVVANGRGVDVSESVISANRRSGIVTTGSGGWFYNNRIGVAADSSEPLPNGASGIFLQNAPGATVSQNVIANHPHFGVAVALPATQPSFLFSRNSIYGNGNAIDYGLDGPTPNASWDATRFPNHPEIESAYYDHARGETVINIGVSTMAHPSLFEWCPSYGSYPCIFTGSEASVEVYAGSRRYLGTVEMGRLSEQGATSLSRSLTVKEDLRRQSISAVTIRRRNDCYTDVCRSSVETSEFSPGVEVR